MGIPARALLQGRYVTGRQLGSGYLGATYLGYDLALQTKVAIREYFPRDFAMRDPGELMVVSRSHEDNPVYEFGKAQFLTESRALARFNHPNIIGVRTFFEENNTAYLVMDFIDGLSLNDYLNRKGGQLPESLSLRLMLSILDGLRAVHEAEQLHLDINPNTIYLRRDGRPLLFDFGSARLKLSDKTRSLSLVLTSGYAAIEQYSSKHPRGPWTDVYGAAALLYRMLTGNTLEDATERIQKANQHLAGLDQLSDPISNTLHAALELLPESRIQSAKAFQDGLLGKSDSRQQPPSAQQASAFDLRALPYKIFALLIGGCLIIAGSGYVVVTSYFLGPTAKPDFTATTEDQPIVVYPLENDLARNPGESLRVSDITTPQSGQARLLTNNTIQYTPRADFWGRDEFSYTIQDEKGRKAVTTITVTIAKSATAKRIDNERTTALSLFSSSIKDSVLADGYTIEERIAFERFPSNTNTLRFMDGPGKESLSLRSGRLILESPSDSLIQLARLPLTYPDFLVRFDLFTHQNSVGGYSIHGTSETVYYVLLNANAEFMIYKNQLDLDTLTWPGFDEQNVLLPWTRSEHIRLRGDTGNRVELKVTGRTLDIYFNEKLSYSVNDLEGRYRSSGGLVAITGEIQFDNYVILGLTG